MSFGKEDHDRPEDHRPLVASVYRLAARPSSAGCPRSSGGARRLRQQRWRVRHPGRGHGRHDGHRRTEHERQRGCRVGFWRQLRDDRLPHLSGAERRDAANPLGQAAGRWQRRGRYPPDRCAALRSPRWSRWCGRSWRGRWSRPWRWFWADVDRGTGRRGRRHLGGGAQRLCLALTHGTGRRPHRPGDIRIARTLAPFAATPARPTRDTGRRGRARGADHDDPCGRILLSGVARGASPQRRWA